MSTSLWNGRLLALALTVAAAVLATPGHAQQYPTRPITLVIPLQAGTPGVGTVNYLASELFAQQANVKVQQIPYTGSNPLNIDLIGGHVKVGFNPITVSRSAMDGGYIRALAATSMKRSTLLPD